MRQLNIIRYAAVIAIVCSSLIVYAQGMAVNTTGTAANSSAILDVSSNTQGVLVPRMTQALMNGIASPATGLLLYCTNCTPAGFYYYTGSAWTSLNALNNVTTQGNTFNGANELVQTNSSAYINTANLGSGVSVDSTKFLRGNNTWGAPIALGNIRNVTSGTTLTSSDQLVLYGGSGPVTITLPRANSVNRGYQIFITDTYYPPIVQAQAGDIIKVGGGYSSSYFQILNYFACVVSDGAGSWYLLYNN